MDQDGARDDPVTEIRNIGPAQGAALAPAGIHTANGLRALGPDAAYAAMIASGTRRHSIGQYLLVMALHGRPWNDCKGAEKDALRPACGRGPPASEPQAEIERLRDPIGTGTRRAR